MVDGIAHRAWTKPGGASGRRISAATSMRVASAVRASSIPANDAVTGEAGALAEHCDRARHRDGVGGQARQTQQDRAPDRARTDLGDGLGVGRVGFDAVARASSSAAPRGAADCRLLRDDKPHRHGFGGVAQAIAHERCDSVSGQRREPDRDRRGVLRELEDQADSASGSCIRAAATIITPSPSSRCAR